MELTRDNDLDLPRANEWTLDAGDVAALTDADVLALLPAWVRGMNTVSRDVVVRAARRFWNRVQARVGRTFAALQSPRHATGLRLREHGAMKRRARAPQEAEHEYRARLLTRPAMITPAALRGAVRSLVLAETPTAPVALEPATEGLFVQEDGGSFPWSCFVQKDGDPPLWADMPDNDIPAGVWLSLDEDVSRPVFVVLIEGPVYDLDDQLFALPEVATAPDVDGLFVGADSPLVSWSYVSSEALPLVDRVVRDVEARRGAGVVWWLLVVPNLRGAK